MSDTRRRIGTAVLAALVVLAAAGADEAELETNRRLLERRKADPEHYARLRRDLADFYAMPEARREKIRAFDHELHEHDVNAQMRLWKVLERYARWVEALPAEQRRRVEEAPTVADRLAVVRDLRSREWVERLPASQREAVRKLPADKQAAEIARLRDEERRQRDVWMKRARSEADPARPRRLTDFPPEVQDFYDAHLKDRLTANEKARLTAAEDKWPEYARTLKQVAESPSHLVLPPLPSGKIVTQTQLPPGMIKHLRRDKGLAPSVKNAREVWPDFALEVVKILEAEKVPYPALGASKPSEFPPETRAWLEKTLPKLVSADAMEKLKADEGKWPAYPRHLHNLHKQAKNRFAIPGMTLPAPTLFAEAMLAKADAQEPSVVAEGLLWRFKAFDLSKEDREALQLSPDDPMGNRRKLEKAFISSKNAEQKRKNQGKKPPKGPKGE